MEAHPECTMCACSTSWLNMLNGKVENHCRISEDRDLSLEDIILEKNGRIFPTVSVFMQTKIWKERKTWGFPIGDYPQAVYSALHGTVHMLKDNMCVYRWYSEGSWTARMDSADRRAVVSEKMIRALELLNEDTGYQHDAIISKRIKRHKYTLALMNHDLDALKSEDLIDMFRSRDLLHRTSDVLRCKYPKFYGVLSKLASRRSR